MLSTYGKEIRAASLALAIEKELLVDRTLRRERTVESSGDENTIVIVGGELFNKGAQAMTFTVVNQLSRRFPDKEIYLLSKGDFKRTREEKSRYEFTILPWGAEVRLHLLSPGLGRFNTNEYSPETVKKVQNVVEEAMVMVDINGYVFSSQYSYRTALGYLTDISIAKKYGIPMYILPQSIGPFDFPTSKKVFLEQFMRTYLPYPEVICPRERAGVKWLSPYTRENVRKEYDIVLQNEEYDLEYIFDCEPDLERKDVRANSVGIVPNDKVFERNDPETLYSIYEAVVDRLQETGKNVYIIQHAVDDAVHCEEIESRFQDDDRVVAFADDYNAIELEHVIGQLDFLVASRYHSIIHAYKNGVPVVAVGWANKYEELLENYDQSEYFVEGRSDLEESDVVEPVERMSERVESEATTVAEQTESVQADNIFERLFG